MVLIALKLSSYFFKIPKIAAEKDKLLTIGNSADSTTSPNISSQSNDGVSIVFNTLSAADAYKSLKQETERIIYTLLSGVTNELGRKLLYRGIYPDDE